MFVLGIIGMKLVALAFVPLLRLYHIDRELF